MPFPWETVPPLAIICGATALMGALPHGVQKLFYGKPKAVLQDSWDRQLGKRDERVLQEWQDKQDSKVRSMASALTLLPNLVGPQQHSVIFTGVTVRQKNSIHVIQKLVRQPHLVLDC